MSKKNKKNRKSNRAQKRSLNYEQVMLSDSDNWLTAIGGEKSNSGVVVNEKTAYSFAPLWRAINLVSSDIAKIPLCVFRRLEGGGQERATTHPAYKLMKTSAAENLTAFIFKQCVQSAAMLGNGYAYIVRNVSTNLPTSMIVLSPTDTFPVRVNGGKIEYVTTVQGMKTRLKAEEVLHIRGLGFDGLVGHSVLDFARDSLGLGMAAEKFGSTVFKNGARPSVLLEHPKKINAEAKRNLKESWNKMHQGIDNSHGTAVLEEGMHATILARDNESVQLMQLREFELKMVANWFGIPPHKVGDSTKNSFSSLEQENQSYLQEALDPWMVNWEQECNCKLLTKPQKDRGTHFFEFVRAALVRADINTRFSVYNIALQNGIMNRDEIRELENLNPIPDGAGQDFLIPMNMDKANGDAGGDPKNMPNDPPADKPAAKKPTSEQKNSLRDLVSHAVRESAIRYSRATKRAAKKPGEFLSWLDAWQESNHEKNAAWFSLSIRAASHVCGFDALVAADEAAARFGILFRHAMLDAAESKPEDLQDSVAAYLINFEDDVCELIASEVVDGTFGRK